MSRASIAIGVSLLVVAAGGAAALFTLPRPDPDVFTPGISQALAENRAARVSLLKYYLTLKVPASRDEPVRGHMTASFALRDRARSLAFDFAQPTAHLLGVTANGNRTEAQIQNGHIVIEDRTGQKKITLAASRGL